MVEAAAAARNGIKTALTEQESRASEGRSELVQHISNIDTVVRAAALKELGDVAVRRDWLQEKLQAAETTVERLRNRLVNRRMAREQVESLVGEHAARLREQEVRRAQQSLDDWFNRKDRTK